MKTVKFILSIMVMLVFFGLDKAFGQWDLNGIHIYNTNTGNVGIGTSNPGKLLDVSKSMTEPTIRIYNNGGSGGATFEMTDLNSGADWKFKATNAGGFKIRDNAFALDVITIEANSSANALYINSAGNVGIGTSTPTSTLTVNGPISYQMTQNDVTASRALNTVYQNTTGRIMYVSVVTVNNTTGTTNIYCDNNASPVTRISSASGTNGWNRPNFFIVLPSYYYKVAPDTGGNIVSWIEWY